jgi:CxC2 like cysteine cluster associated with KDZ transposases
MFWQSQNDYLREWLPKQKEYLRHLLESEHPANERTCSICLTRDGVYRCKGCFGWPLYCTGCCRSSHLNHPFHRIEQWQGTYFHESWLTHVGVRIHLGHGGKRCPQFTGGGGGGNVDSSDSEWSDDEETGPPSMPGAAEKGQDKESHRDEAAAAAADPQEGIPMVIVARTGVHNLNVIMCQCPDADPMDIQLLKMQLYPASFVQPRTAFTFNVLDDFLLDKLEAGNNANNYYSKLRRLTSSTFPHRVRNRYRELMRAARMWQLLKLLKWHGFGHMDRAPEDGELALFCPTCPQPNVNLPDTPLEDLTQ